MSIEVLACDPTDWSEQSLFTNDYQTQYCSDITTSQLSLDDTVWMDDMKGFWDSFELDFNNDPEFALSAMNKEVEIQSQTKTDDVLDGIYVDSSAMLSPVSIAPSSPQLCDNFEQNLDLSLIESAPIDDDLQNTSAMDILDKILSGKTTDSEPSEEYFDSELDVQYITEVTKETQNEQKLEEISAEEDMNVNRKRQNKRKLSGTGDNTNTKSKPIKRTKTSVNEKKERKRNQNKSAANRYRLKKRAELETIDSQQKDQMEINQQLRAQLQKIQMEFKVVYPLAKAAFSTDNKKVLLLQMLDIRILNNNLLD